MSGSDLRETFFIECEDLLEACDSGLRELEGDGADSEVINSVFRAVHSMKGGAGAFKLVALVAFAHKFETVLDRLRSGDLVLDDAVLKLLMRASDHLSDLVAAARDGDVTTDDAPGDLVAGLDGYAGAAEPDAAAGADLVFAPMELDFSALAAPISAGGTYLIRIAPAPGFYQAGHDPLVILRNLAALGPIEVISVSEDLPDWDQISFGEGHFTWEARLTTERSVTDIQDVIEFVEDAVTCTPEGGEVPAEISGESTDASLPLALTAAPDVTPPPPDEGEAAREPPAEKAAGGPARQTVRVDLDRVDKLINTVGELVINQAVLAQAIARAGQGHASDDLDAALDSLRNLSREIQEGVMAIRAQPIKSAFQRMFRICREAADAAGKQINLVTRGEMTEVDKTVIENLSDPLTHMIRNSVDHGVEGPEARLAAGKPEVGQITLSAAHRSGRVVIEIADDGAGINRERVRQIALDKGLIAADADLTTAEVDGLIFLPGFSTAREVSALSGRGVGMDVVKRAIQALGGRVSITSVPGRGTTFTISLPLTLAVMDGMVVDIAGEEMVVPITAIVETLKPDPGDVHRVGQDTSVISVRGVVTRLVDLGRDMGFRSSVHDIENRVLLLTETESGQRAALIVDRIHDQRQVVIKSLEANYRSIPGVSAATILGNGRIALIIDPDQLAGPTLSTPGDRRSTLAA